MMKSISVIGLGKLGACMAATMASKGMQVIGVDVNEKSVNLINQGLAPVVEPHLSDLITANRKRLRATTNCKAAVLESEATFIIVPTPSDETGGFTLKYVAEAVREIGAALREKPGYHLVVLTSTVLPGAMESGVLPILEQVSGKKRGRDFGLCYNPEFIALGSVIHDLLNPDFILIGESDEKAGEMLANWYHDYCDNKPQMARMNFVNAELSKISVNSFVTMKITFANMLANLCEGLPGADVDQVSGALGMDSRIGRKYLTGALGYGGPCFPRDNKALLCVAERAGIKAALPESTDRMNRLQVTRLSEKIRSMIHPGMTISILGLAYKPDTNVVEEAPGVALAASLAGPGHQVTVFDPLAMENARAILKDKVTYADTLSESLKQADLVVIVNPCNEFKALSAKDFVRKNATVIVFDCWRILQQKLDGASGIDYIGIGVGNSAELASKALTEAAV